MRTKKQISFISIALTFSLATIILLSGTLAFAQSYVSGESEPCHTQIIYNMKYGFNKSSAACATLGDCDDAGIRNSWIPDPTDPPIILNLYFHVMRNDDGSNAAASAQDVADAVDALNREYLPWAIQFEYEMQFVNNTTYRLLNTNGEFNNMKNLYAINPDSQCNIYVAAVNVDGKVYSFGTFPWDSDALGKTGGIVMNRTQFPPYSDKVITHEMGHNLGLWHTHHGVDEVTQCGGCYETPGSNSDGTGDFCADTDPTPTNYGCGGPGGSDPCSGAPWGFTDPQNHMGYGPDYCVTEFSPQQAGRMHCWSTEVLTSWMDNVRIQADVTLGPVPLDVTFDGVTAKTVNSWSWEFGDGGTANTSSPFHSYTEPGLYDVLATIDATDGTYETLARDLIWAYADTLLVVDTYPIQSVSTPVHIYARNYLPLAGLKIPYSWEGPWDITFDSATTVGLRTEYMPTNQEINYDLNNKRGCYYLLAGNEPMLPPDTGAVLTLYVTVNNFGSWPSSPINIISYYSKIPTFYVTPGDYMPVLVGGRLNSCIAGDVNGDGTGGDIVDLTAIIDYLFGPGPNPHPISGSVDGIPGVDILDLTYFVDYLFGTGPSPVCD